MTNLSIGAALFISCAVQAAEVRPGVEFAGVLENAGTPRAVMQNLLLDLAAAWTGCDDALMKKTLAENVDFSYPANHIVGIDNAVTDLKHFCDQAKDVSIYFPADAFYIDRQSGRIAAELQFRSLDHGARHSINDVWLATVRDSKIAVIKEYLDGRVGPLQTQGVLALDENAASLAPWPSRADAWKNCLPSVQVKLANACPAK